MSKRLQDKVAIVTGGISGIGRAISLAYHAEGAKVVVADIRTSSRANEGEEVGTHEVIQKDGGTAVFKTVDTTDSKAVDALVEEVVKEFGRLDIMVNCAGVAPEGHNPQPVWETTDDTWNTTIAVNSSGVFNGTRAAARQMIKQEPHASGDRGWIINLASVYGLVGMENTTAYVSSKHAVMGLTKCAALDLGPHMVHCNAINPGYIRSPFTQHMFADPDTANFINSLHTFRGAGVPEDVSRIAVFLASDDARWVTGTGIVVDGAYTTR